MKPKRILLGVTGSVAATLTPKLVKGLVEARHLVQLVATEPSLYFFDRRDLIHGVDVWEEETEWPNGSYVKDQEIPHIDLSDWADILLIAPLTANTLAKMANGICDNLLTSIVRAWPHEKPIVLAPAMNTRMWENRMTELHIISVGGCFRQVLIVEPISKKLACGDVGKGAMADIANIIKVVSDPLLK